MSKLYTCVITIKSDVVRCVTNAEGVAARFLTGGTTYNAIPQPTKELAIRAAEESARNFRRLGYVYDRNWKKKLKLTAKGA